MANLYIGLTHIICKEAVSKTSKSCWSDMAGIRAGPHPVTEQLRGIWVTHHLLWSLAGLSKDFFHVVRAGLGHKLTFCATADEAIAAIGATADTLVTDNPTDQMYKTLIAICLLGKPATDQGEFVEVWSKTRFASLLAEANKKSLMFKLTAPPREVFMYGDRFNGDIDFTTAVVRYLVNIEKHVGTGMLLLFAKQCLMILGGSGMEVSKAMFEFTTLDNSKVWTLPGLLKEGQKFHKAWCEFGVKYGSNACFGRLLKLNGISSLDHAAYMRLYQVTVISQRGRGAMKNLHYNITNPFYPEAILLKLLGEDLPLASTVVMGSDVERDFAVKVLGLDLDKLKSASEEETMKLLEQRAQLAKTESDAKMKAAMAQKLMAVIWTP